MTIHEVFTRTDKTTFGVFYGCLLMGPVKNSQNRLAHFIAVGRATMHRSLEKLVALGAVRVEQDVAGIRVFVLVDPPVHHGQPALSTVDTPPLEEFSLSHPPGPGEMDPVKAEYATRIDGWFEEEFWPAVWRKVSKEKAREQWPEALKRAAKQLNTKSGKAAKDFLVAAAKRWTEFVAALGDPTSEQAKLHPRTWLSQSRWTDELNLAKSKQESLWDKV